MRNSSKSVPAYKSTGIWYTAKVMLERHFRLDDKKKSRTFLCIGSTFLCWPRGVELHSILKPGSPDHEQKMSSFIPLRVYSYNLGRGRASREVCAAVNSQEYESRAGS
jgi:hypothetical protein